MNSHSNYCDEIIFNNELHKLSSVLICKRNNRLTQEKPDTTRP